MTRRTQQQWFELFEAHEQSNLTAAEFCREHQLCLKYFSLRKQQLNWQPRQTPALIPVMIASDTESAENATVLAWGEVTLSIPSSTSPTWVAQLMRALQ